MLLNSHKNGKNLLTLAFIAQKPFLAIFVIFGQLWIVVYTAIIKYFELYRMSIGVI